MRAFELRVYKLRAKEALDFYMEMIYSHHPNSFPLFGIEAHGFWTANAPEQFRTNSAQPARLLCLCSPAGQGGCSGRSESRCQPEPQCLQSQRQRRKSRSKIRRKHWLQKTQPFCALLS